jgi:hypothetical protein
MFRRFEALLTDKEFIKMMRLSSTLIANTQLKYIKNKYKTIGIHHPHKKDTRKGAWSENRYAERKKYKKGDIKKVPEKTDKKERNYGDPAKGIWRGVGRKNVLQFWLHINVK